MPPPPAGHAATWPAFLFRTSATIASVVIRESRDRGRVLDRHANHLVGSMMPWRQVASYSPVCESRRRSIAAFSRILPTMTEPSSPALIAIWRAGADSALRTISTPVFWSSFLCATPRECSEDGQGDAAARDDAFLDCRAGRMHRVINAILALPSPRPRSRRRRGSPRRRLRAWQDAPGASHGRSPRWSPRSAP